MKQVALMLSVVLLAPVAHALELFANSTTGSDNNNCESPEAACKTVNRACELIPQGQNSLLHLADGRYKSTHCDISHFRFAVVVGNIKKPQNVIVEAPEGNIFSVQGHATLILQGATLQTSAGGKGAFGMLTRQFSIGDIFHVRLGTLLVGVAASEMSKANCLGDISVAGNIDRLFAATSNATATVACDITFKNSPVISTLYYAIQESRIEGRGGVHWQSQCYKQIHARPQHNLSA